jgi:3-phenylpropionate/trans-cinnamate dioxygenase ferredoxin subunit
MGKYVVGTVEEIRPGTRKIVEIAGRAIGVFNIGGEFFALRNRCPHQGGPLCEGRLSGLLEAPSPGEFTYTRPGEILRCPWHAWEYDIRTGQSYLNPAEVRVRRYEVAVEAGSAVAAEAPAAVASIVTIEGAGTKTAGQSGLRHGPYKAETYPVTLEDRYVVVELET